MINIFKTLGSIIIVVISTIAVFAYFLIPTIFGLSSTLSQVSGKSFTSTLHYWTLLNSDGLFYSFLNTGFTLKSNVSTLLGWEWFNFYISYPFFIISNITIPILAFSSLFFIRKFKFYLNKNIYFFYFLAITGIILDAGLKGPTGFIYNWLFYHIVFIRAFDTLHLWYSPIIYLSYSIMVGASIYIILESLNGYINKKFNNKTHIKLIKKIQISNKNIKYMIIIAILFILMIPSYPLLDGSAVPHGTPSADVQLPNYVKETSNYLNSKSNISTVLALPIFIDDSEELYPNGGYRGTNPLEYLLKDPIITQLNGLSPVQSSELKDLNSAIYEKNYLLMNYYLSLLNIRYILVLGDYNSTYNPIIAPFSLNNSLLALNNSPNITLINQFGPYYLYKYNNGHNLLYPAIAINSNNINIQNSKNLINGNINYTYAYNASKYAITNYSVPDNQSLSNIKISSIKYLNPTNIKIDIKVIKSDSFTLVFGQNYNHNWYIENTSYMKVKHILVNNFMNAWIISFSSSGNFTIHIIFTAQKPLQHSAYFSLASTILLVAIYIELLYKKSYIFKH